MSTVSWLEGAGLGASGSQLASRAPQVTVWVLAAALGVQAAVIVTRLAGSGTPPPRHEPLAVPAGSAHASLNVAALINSHLFREAPPPPPVDDANAPQSNMPLLLTGIIAASDPKNGLAIIGTAANNSKLYPVGGRVPGNAVVHAVYVDRVVLDRNGALESLVLARKFGPGGPPINLPGPSPLDRVQRVISNEPGVISDVLRPQPVFAEGKLRGYRVYPGPNARAFASLGLRNGDLVLAINGIPLDDPSHGNDIFNGMSSSDQARVTVMRNGQQQDITLNMSQIANQAEQLGNGAAEGAAVPVPGEPLLTPTPDQPTNGGHTPPGYRDNR